MEFRILGPLEVRDEEGRELPLGSLRQRALLALLLLHAGELVSSDRLIDELWGERVPATAAKIVQNYVSRLRHALGDGQLVTRGHGYVLELQPDALDLHRFESLAARGARALTSGDPKAASENLREALALWRGPPLADFAYEPFAQSAIARLEERRLEATEGRIEADLELGLHAEEVGELEELVQRNPLRERLHAQLMLALYRSGRQAEALAAYRAIRTALVEELGLEPGEELQKLHRAILTHDPQLVAPPKVIPALAARTPGTAPIARRLRHPRLIIGLVVVLLAASSAIALALTWNSNPRPFGIAGNGVAIVDPRYRRVTGQITLHSRPTAIAADDAGAWVASGDDETVTRIDTKTRRIAATIPVGATASDVAIGEDAVWVTGGRSGNLIRIDKHTNRVDKTIVLSGSGKPVPEGVSTVVAGAGAIWVGTGAGLVLKINPRTGKLVDRIPVGTAPIDIALAGGNLWVVSAGGYVLRIDTRTDKVTGTVPAAPYARSITAGEGAVWITSAPREGGGLIWRVDPLTLTVAGATTTLDQAPAGITSGGGAVWVAGGPSGTLIKIDPATGRTMGSIHIGNAPLDPAYGDGAIWVAVAARPLPPP